MPWPTRFDAVMSRSLPVAVLLLLLFAAAGCDKPGDQGGGTTREMTGKAERLRDLEGSAQVVWEHPDVFFDAAKAELPTVEMKVQTQLDQIRRQVSELQQGSVALKALRGPRAQDPGAAPDAAQSLLPLASVADWAARLRHD